MKLLATKKMKQLLRKGKYLAKKDKLKVTSPDYMYMLINDTLKNGWHYNVDLSYSGIHVYAFKPPLDFRARPADYYLASKFKKRKGGG